MSDTRTVASLPRQHATPRELTLADHLRQIVASLDAADAQIFEGEPTDSCHRLLWQARQQASKILRRYCPSSSISDSTDAN